MRKGPYPLSAHIGLMASAAPAAGEGGEEQFADLMSKMLLGIRAYQLHPYERPAMELHTQWQAGEVTVSTPGPELKAGKPVLLLVPSMVNRSTILDLMPQRSMLRWMEGQGITACLLDWGEPLKDEGLASVDNCITKRLVPAIEFVAKQTGGPVHVLGYCMGGTLLMGAAQRAGEYIKSLVFLAAPWDFHAGTKNLHNRVQFWAPSAGPLVAEKGYLPMDWIQTVFASMDPSSTAHKFAAFAAKDPATEDAQIFVAVEDWLNDGADLPAALAQQPIAEWFAANQPARGEWHVAGQPVLPHAIACPALVVTSHQDRLVEHDSAAALAQQIPGATLLETGCGHIGMMAGKRAIEKVWQPIAAWVKKYN